MVSVTPKYESILDETPIWRYIQLGPFLELLMNSCLFQARVDTFDDMAEGAYGYRAVTIDESVARYLRIENRFFVDDTGRHSLPLSATDIIKAAREKTFVTCWFTHEDNESYGMWRVYGRDPFAVAIVTTVGALRNIFTSESTRIGQVVYSSLPLKVCDVHTLFFHKREEYRDEREVRSVRVIQEATTDRFLMQPLTAEQMDALLSRIVVAPGMRRTMYDTLLAVIQNRFALLNRAFEASRLQHSSLDRDLLR
jgi:hypothetical protein